MKIEFIFIDNYDKVDKEKSILLNIDYNNRYVIQKGNYISIDNIEYCIVAVKGIYEEGELVSIVVKVQKDKF